MGTGHTDDLDVRVRFVSLPRIRRWVHRASRCVDLHHPCYGVLLNSTRIRQNRAPWGSRVGHHSRMRAHVGILRDDIPPTTASRSNQGQRHRVLDQGSRYVVVQHVSTKLFRLASQLISSRHERQSSHCLGSNGLRDNNRTLVIAI
jgi:hypothetical protein